MTMNLVGEFTIGGNDNKAMLTSLDQQRSEVQFCDVVLAVDDHTFPAHRCVLAAASPYFRSMFEEYHFSESRSKQVELKGDSLTKRAIEVLLDMVYSGNLRLDVDCMHLVLAAADLLLMTEVKFACSEFMLLVLRSDTATEEALRIRRSAELYSLTDLLHEADRVITAGFAQVAQSGAFLEQSEEEVLSLLKSDYIQEGDEHIFWQAAIEWTKHDLTERLPSLDALMQCVRFPLIEPQILVGVIQCDDLMVKSASCSRLLEEAVKYQLLGRFQSSLQTPRSRPRCTTRDTVVYCMSNTNLFKCFVPKYNKWYSLAAPRPLESTAPPSEQIVQTSSHLSLVSVGGLVYACTQAIRPEQVGHFEMTRLQQYNLEQNKWSDCTLPAKVSVPTFLIECSNTLYACSRSAVERYHSEQDKWEVVSISRLSPCQFAVTDENRILLYSLEDGVVQEICMDRPNMVTTRQVMSPNRFISEVISATKLSNHEVFLSMRTLSGSGVSRKIFNVNSHQWRDAGIFQGSSASQPRPGQHHPLWLDATEPWVTMSDRNSSSLFVLSPKSGLADIPAQPTSTTRTYTSYRHHCSLPPPIVEPAPSGDKTDGAKPARPCLDAVLPFFRINLTTKAWTRLACLPEFMGATNIHTCISDGQASMGSAAVL